MSTQFACRASLTAGQTALIAAQKHEEAVLQKAVHERREQFGPPANLYSEPVSQAFSFRLPPRQSQQSAASSSQQQPQSSPVGFQPRTRLTTPQADPASDPALETQQGFPRRDQAGEQGASSSMQNPSRGQVPYQAQNTAPAGFVQFGVEPKG